MFSIEINKDRSNLPHYAYHQCKVKFDNKREAEIVYGEWNGNDKQWWLHIYRTSTWEDIENDKADAEGEAIEQEAIPIQYCPYCGKDLYQDLKSMRTTEQKNNKNDPEPTLNIQQNKSAYPQSGR